MCLIKEQFSCKHAGFNSSLDKCVIFMPGELHCVTVPSYTQGGAICLLPTDPAVGVISRYIMKHTTTYSSHFVSLI
jgi:hypothetical protein